MRASTNVENVDEYSSILKEFGGVDFSTPTLNVSPTRAVQAVNFINKHGSNCKRNGYEQILQFTDEKISLLYMQAKAFIARTIMANTGRMIT